jgi:hypothetical protein
VKGCSPEARPVRQGTNSRQDDTDVGKMSVEGPESHAP